MAIYLRALLITASPEEAAGGISGHREHLAALHRAGKLRSAGELAAGEGFVELIEVADLHEAEAINAESPLVREGLATWILREWRELTFD